MIMPEFTARHKYCIADRLAGLPPEKWAFCSTDSCPSWRWYKVPKAIKLDDNNRAKYSGYCGFGGVPTCEAQQVDMDKTHK